LLGLAQPSLCLVHPLLASPRACSAWFRGAVEAADEVVDLGAVVAAQDNAELGT
jgi:hypothetical protein